MSFSEIYIKNNTFDPSLQDKFGKPRAANEPMTEGEQLLFDMRNNKGIQEKNFGDISSFNFTRETFYKGEWDKETIKARGLFMNTVLKVIVARGFEKFFAYKEGDFNSDEFLQANLAYPVRVYKKYNGFLGILGYTDDGLLFCSKSRINGDFADYFKTIFHANGYDEAKLYDYMRRNNVGLIFEVIDHVHDPHIVEYDKDEIILLDVVKLRRDWNALPYDELVKFSAEYGFKFKELAREFNNWESLYEFMNTVVTDNSTEIEGYVIEDAKNYQFKLKGAWYKFWKALRGIKDRVANGKSPDTKDMPAEFADVVKWLEWKGAEYCKTHSIIQCRNDYENDLSEGSHLWACPDRQTLLNELDKSLEKIADNSRFAENWKNLHEQIDKEIAERQKAAQVPPEKWNMPMDI